MPFTVAQTSLPITVNGTFCIYTSSRINKTPQIYHFLAILSDFIVFSV